MQFWPSDAEHTINSMWCGGLYTGKTNHDGMIMEQTEQDTYRECQVLASEDPDPRDGAVVICAEEDHTRKGGFAEPVKALEHSWKEKPQSSLWCLQVTQWQSARKLNSTSMLPDNMHCIWYERATLSRT